MCVYSRGSSLPSPLSADIPTYIITYHFGILWPVLAHYFTVHQNPWFRIVHEEFTRTSENAEFINTQAENSTKNHKREMKRSSYPISTNSLFSFEQWGIVELEAELVSYVT